MNFETSNELRAVQDSLTKLLANHYTAVHRQALAEDVGAYARQAWREMIGLGLAGLQIPEEFGGFGTRATDMLPVCHELGRALAPVPFLSSSVLSVAALCAAGERQLQCDLLPGLAEGTLQVACTHDPAAKMAEVCAQVVDGKWRLRGLQRHLPYAASSDWLIVAARLQEGAVEAAALFLLNARSPELQLRSHRLIDGTPASDVRLSEVAATPLGTPCSAEARAVIEAVVAAGIAAACAEMVGAMEAAFRLTVDYLKTRQQFGRLIGDNQALRHRTAEMLVGLEMARSLSIAAAVAAGRSGLDDPEARADLHRAKFLVGRNARNLCHAAIQLHGGIGMTEEYFVGHYLRRVHVLDHQFGDSGMHLEQLAEVA